VILYPLCLAVCTCRIGLIFLYPLAKVWNENLNQLCTKLWVLQIQCPPWFNEAKYLSIFLRNPRAPKPLPLPTFNQGSTSVSNKAFADFRAMHFNRFFLKWLVSEVLTLNLPGIWLKTRVDMSGYSGLSDKILLPRLTMSLLKYNFLNSNKPNSLWILKKLQNTIKS